MNHVPLNGKEPLTKNDFMEWVANVFIPLKEEIAGLRGKLNVICGLIVAIFVAVFTLLISGAVN